MFGVDLQPLRCLADNVVYDLLDSPGLAALGGLCQFAHGDMQDRAFKGFLRVYLGKERGEVRARLATARGPARIVALLERLEVFRVICHRAPPLRFSVSLPKIKPLPGPDGYKRVHRPPYALELALQFSDALLGGNHAAYTRLLVAYLLLKAALLAQQLHYGGLCQEAVTLAAFAAISRSRAILNRPRNFSLPHAPLVVASSSSCHAMASSSRMHGHSVWGNAAILIPSMYGISGCIPVARIHTQNVPS